MTKYTVNQYAKSTLRGKRGEVVAISSGRSEWRRGLRHAKYLCLVFSDGDFAGRRLWFKRAELNIAP